MKAFAPAVILLMIFISSGKLDLQLAFVLFNSKLEELYIYFTV